MLPVPAALAFVEKGQNALTRLGTKAAIRATTTNPVIKNCEVNLMGKRGRVVGLSNTKMAYIQDISHFLKSSVSVDRRSITE